MAVTKTLIKASATESTGPDEVLSRVNSEISRDNDSCMFVTVFCGILDTRTGEISYANGGHNPPLVLRKDKGAEFLGGEHGPALGAVENKSAGNGIAFERLQLAHGHCLPANFRQGCRAVFFAEGFCHKVKKLSFR